MGNSPITFEIQGDESHYSCGCVTKVVGTNFFITPCSPDCEVWRYAKAESRRQGKHISILVAQEGK